MTSLEISNIHHFSITWTINNYNYCWQKQDEPIASPIFSIFTPVETRWKLLVFPRGTREGKWNLFLHREQDCNGAENIEMESSLEILSADGLISKSFVSKHIFFKNSQEGCAMFLKRASVMKYSKETAMSHDALPMRCTIKYVNGKSVEIREMFARTIINVERRCLLWTIEEFSSLMYGQKRCLVIKSATNEELVKIDLSLTGECGFFEDVNQISLNIYPINKYVKSFILQTFLVNLVNLKFNSGRHENWCESGGFSTFPLTFTKDELIRDRDSYLPNDVLSLRLEFAITTGFAFEGVTKIDFGKISHETTNEVRENWRRCDVEENALITDLMCLYKDKSLCDVKLLTNTNEYPVLITILGARSPVFSSMFSTNMEERLNGVVDVSDLDDETVQQLISFMYTNRLEDLKWEDALRLYEAADKYAITSLKDRCSLFLKGNLSLENACVALILSDLHQDQSLKSAVQDFILKNAREIFKYEEWKLLSDTNPKLALETALLKWT